MSRASNGALVFDFLQKAYPSPRRADEIALGAHLSYSQVQSGLNHIREVLGPIHAEPLIYKPYMIARTIAGKKQWVQHTYVLSADAAEIKEYGAYRLRIHTKQLRNLALVLEAGMEKTGDTSLGVLIHSIGQAADTAEFVQRELLGAP